MLARKGLRHKLVHKKSVCASAFLNGWTKCVVLFVDPVSGCTIEVGEHPNDNGFNPFVLSTNDDLRRTPLGICQLNWLKPVFCFVAPQYPSFEALN